VQDRPEDAQAIVERTGVTYRTLRDRDGAALTFYEAIQMPATVFLDAAGAPLDRVDGAMTEAELRDKLADVYGVQA
jgi:hypothetical protein